MRLSMLGCITVLVFAMLMSFSFATDANAAALSNASAKRAALSDKSCRNVHAAARPGSPCLTGPADGAMSSIDATSLAETLLSTVAKSAGNKIGGAIAGWALDSIFGSSATSTDELKAQLDGLQNQMTDLQTQVHSLDVKLDDSLKKLMTQADRNTYDEVAAQTNSDAAELADYQIQLDSWLKRAPGTPVDGSQSSELQTMRSSLGVIIQHINIAMIGTTGSRGLIAIYRSVIQAQTPYPTDRFYTSDFTTPMSDMLDYYGSLAVQAFNMLAEVNHLSWTVGGTTFAANNTIVETYATLVPTKLAQWNQLATGGAGRLPEGVVADTTTGLMWTRTGLTLGGSPFFCYAGCGSLSLSTLLTPNTVIDRLTGWAVPSQTQFAALLAGRGFGGLAANGFQWQSQSGPTVIMAGIRFAAPAYWASGGTTIAFFDERTNPLLSPWPSQMPGPGAVAVRAID